MGRWNRSDEDYARSRAARVTSTPRRPAAASTRRNLTELTPEAKKPARSSRGVEDRIGDDRVVRYERAEGIRDTERALLAQFGGQEAWIPKSQIHAHSEVRDEGDEGELIITRWMAEKEGWI